MDLTGFLEFFFTPAVSLELPVRAFQPGTPHTHFFFHSKKETEEVKIYALDFFPLLNAFKGPGLLHLNGGFKLLFPSQTLAFWPANYTTTPFGPQTSLALPPSPLSQTLRNSWGLVASLPLSPWGWLTKLMRAATSTSLHGRAGGIVRLVVTVPNAPKAPGPASGIFQPNRPRPSFFTSPKYN